MLRLPITNRSRNGHERICVVKVTRKNATKIKQGVILKGYNPSDIISNGVSFNTSVYNTPGGDPNKTVNFLRNFNYRSDKRDFLITTKEYADSTLYDLYKVDMPGSKISSGADNLFGSVILDMKNESPDNEKGKTISLKKLGIDKGITEDKISKLEYIMKTEKDPQKRLELMQFHGVSDLKNIIDYLKEFRFQIVSGATMSVEEYKSILNSFKIIRTKETKALANFYMIAEENKEVYDKLTRISKILYNKPLGLIENPKKQKILIKTKDEVTSNDRGSNSNKNAA